MLVDVVIAAVNWHSILYTGVTTASFLVTFIIAFIIGLLAL
ncbi:MAG: hypothetical protein WCB79_01695 [Halobacteriota archaeon]